MVEKNYKYLNAFAYKEFNILCQNNAAKTQTLESFPIVSIKCLEQRYLSKNTDFFFCDWNVKRS